MKVKFDTNYRFERTVTGFSVGREDSPETHYFLNFEGKAEFLEQEFAASQDEENRLEYRHGAMKRYEDCCRELLKFASHYRVMGGADACRESKGRRKPLPVVEGMRDRIDPGLVIRLYALRRGEGMTNREIADSLNGGGKGDGPLYTKAGRPWTKEALESFVSRWRNGGGS